VWTRLAAFPTGRSTVLLELLAVLYDPIRGLVLTVVLVKDRCTMRSSSLHGRVLLYCTELISVKYLLCMY
jgi:hypothetical protein